MEENEEGLTLPIHFRNEQWAVTGYGLECVDKDNGHYEIEKCRLGEADRGFPDWPPHMAGKSWVSPELFMEAFMLALWVHRGAYNYKPFTSGDWMSKVSKELERRMG
jgi:hypothetical protein